MNGLLITNIVTILIALTAGMVALYQVKSNVISNARIKWIENLRETVSQYCTQLDACSYEKNRFLFEIMGKSEKDLETAMERFYSPYAELAREVLMLQSKTLLYLNSTNEKHKQIEDLLKVNSLLLHAKYEDNGIQIRRNIEKIISLSKYIFEEEWRNARRIFNI